MNVQYPLCLLKITFIPCSPNGLKLLTMQFLLKISNQLFVTFNRWCYHTNCHLSLYRKYSVTDLIYYKKWTNILNMVHTEIVEHHNYCTKPYCKLMLTSIKATIERAEAYGKLLSSCFSQASIIYVENLEPRNYHCTASNHWVIFLYKYFIYLFINFYTGYHHVYKVS